MIEFFALMQIGNLVVVGFACWLVLRAVTALQQLVSAQERSANTLAEIAKKLGNQP
jgi:uncharacterized membrane protein